ncbi:MAG: hypothetical protein EOP88_22765 [Verrucomicrobiaceae bacterium]|nr:MAG: hypothetical protein EOP88_22765 [Verrucomicrobiaceae bacterium]
MIEDSILTYLEEGLLPGISVWNASFFPAEGVTTCKALRLTGWDGTLLQIGATRLLTFSKVTPAWQYEEDGTLVDEPETTEIEEYRFLQLEDPGCRNPEHAAVHEIFVGMLESVDAFYATHQLPTAEGGCEQTTVLAGVRFNYTEGLSGGFESSFAFIQKTPDGSFELGPASVVLRDLPTHISAPKRLSAF